MSSKRDNDTMQADISALESKRLVLQQIVDITNVEDVQPDIEVVEIGSVTKENQDRSFSDAAPSLWKGCCLSFQVFQGG
ncbi:MAG: hypothetical protein KZQ78_18690 [Candidatus Thiodiazotropha sp. (ex Ustalcina ferruginea)]|nr:hypothetical protein [Candidatus Thiodiazotropha sp. (ex Ustalcina ferruginea)]